MLAMHLERERERGYIYLYLPGVSKVFPLEEEKKETFLLFFSSSFPRNEKSLVPGQNERLKRRSNLYRISSPLRNRNKTVVHSTSSTYLPPRVARNIGEREREREGGRESAWGMLVLHRLGPRWEPAANWKLSLITGEHVGRSTPISRGGYCSLSVPFCPDPLPYLRIPPR